MKKLFTLAAVLATVCLVTSASASRVRGIDVSSYQGHPAWGSVHGNGDVFAFAKATEGTYYHDADYTYNMVNGKANGVQMGAYDFTIPGSYCANTEADYFWAFAGGYITTDGKSLYPMADFESFGGHACYTSYTGWYNAWEARVKTKKTVFMHPVVYASACNGMCDLATSCTLSSWVANYNGESYLTGTPWSSCSSCNYVAPGTTGSWTYWQYTSTGTIPGISGNVDHDVYPLSLAELIDYQGL